jgi:hypothetical protein
VAAEAADAPEPVADAPDGDDGPPADVDQTQTRRTEGSEG